MRVLGKIGLAALLGLHTVAALASPGTPNGFLAGGTPTFIVGTAGDERSDRAIAAQVELIRGLLFPGARVVPDTSVDVDAGPAAWPPRPILYGGAHVNHLVRALAPSLPLLVDRGKLALGARTFDGEDYFLIAVVPGRPAGGGRGGYPEFLLYAGTGTPGVAEINAVSHGAEPILVADVFGRLAAGRWVPAASGETTAELGPAARRIAWRAVERALAGAPGSGEARVRFLFPRQLPAAAHEEPAIAASLRGLATVVSKLQIGSPASVSVYVYPDRGSKRSLTGNAGDGHAVAAARSLHVIATGGSGGELGALEGLMAHEGTHVLAHEAWGPAGSSFLGEGLAVWAAGRYGGTSLVDWRARLAPPASIAELLGASFRRTPEARSYPLAGLFIEVAVAAVGLNHLRDHLYGATAEGWDQACRSAGTTPAALQEAFSSLLGPR